MWLLELFETLSFLLCWRFWLPALILGGVAYLIAPFIEGKSTVSY